MKIYLASASPRRKILLRQAGVSFEILKPEYIEKNSRRLSPKQIVKDHAIGKAYSVLDRIRDGIIVSADTLVFFNGKVLGKPKNMSRATWMLKALSGQKHEVWTGVCLLKKVDGYLRRKKYFFDKTTVWIKEMSSSEISRYLSQVNPLDKAGGYAAQSSRMMIVKRVRGSFSNVVGLPMEKLKKALNMLN